MCKTLLLITIFTSCITLRSSCSDCGEKDLLLLHQEKLARQENELEKILNVIPEDGAFCIRSLRT
jgi:hypothetical protein